MKIRKKQQTLANILFKQSLDRYGALDTAKVRQILQKIARAKVEAIPVLRAYKKKIADKLTREQILVESAVQFKNPRELAQKLTQTTGAKKVIYKINPQLVFGVKIRHGDWVWDETLGAKLEQLTTDI